MEEYVELDQSGQLRLTPVAALLRGQPTTPLPQAIKEEKDSHQIPGGNFVRQSR